MLKTLFRAAALAIIPLSMILASPTIENKSRYLEAYERKVEIPVEQNANKIVVTIKAQTDNRADRLQRFLVSQKSPLAPYAVEFVKIADKNGLDWKFLPSIAGVESTFGLAVPAGSYNPYGWNNGKTRFSGWVNATEIVATGIRTGYAPTGVVTPQRIGSRYAAAKTWAVRVVKNMQKIAQFN